MGFLYKNVCLPDIDQAQLNECQDFTSINYVGPDTYRHTCQATQGGYSVVTELNGQITNLTPITFSSYPTCTHEGGVGLSYDYFLVALAFLALIWGGKKLIQLFEVPHVE